MPLPDLVAVNGAAARDQYLKGGYPQELLVEVEALRYQYLANVGGGRKPADPEIPARLRVLVLGEYLALNTERQMRLLEETAPYLPKNVKFIVKPHPACPVRAEDYPGLELEITNERISHLLGSCDVAYTNNATSAAVDACCAGVPVVSMLDPESFNLSPLRGREGVQFVSTPGELARALIGGTSDVRGAFQPTEFFALDPSLSRWRKLLSGVT